MREEDTENARGAYTIETVRGKICGRK